MMTSLVIQNNHIFDLFKNQFLNSSKLRRLYKSYFALSLLSFTGFTFINLQTDDFSKLIFTIPILLISSVYLIRCSIAKIDPFDQYENQLLISSNIQSPAVTITEIVNIQVPKIKTSQGQFKSEDVSPIISTNNKSTHVGSLVSKDNNLSAPILATLLGAETVMASPITTNPISAAAAFPYVPLLVSLSFVLSQWCYITAIFKSNVYTPLRQYLLTTIINLTISLALIVLTEFKFNDIAVIQFGQTTLGMKVCNYGISVMLLIQSLTTIVLLIMSRHRENKDALQVVEVYNSISSPISA